MHDNVVKIGKSMIQYDKENNRVYLMKMHKDDCNHIVEDLEEIAGREKYTKIIGKIPFFAKSIFMEKGYSIEATIPKLYKGEEDGIFVVKYFSKDRQKEEFKETIDNVLKESNIKDNKNIKDALSQEFTYRTAKEEDAEVIAKFYKKIFKTYPFPIYDCEYILETMRDNIKYFTIWKGNELVAASSTEIDYEKLNVEMTDFGTLYDYRENGLAVYLLEKMEEEMIKIRIKTAYTIARAGSYGMNMVFSKNGYVFAGTLTNNTNISGKIESMNVWYKELIN